VGNHDPGTRMKEYYKALEEMIDRMVENTLTDEEYQAAEKQLTDHIRNYYKQREDKIKQKRAEIMKKMTTALIEYFDTYPELELEEKDREILVDELAKSLEETTQDMVTQIGQLIQTEKMLKKAFEEEKKSEPKVKGDPLMDYVRGLLK
jgi:hypothetical protein